jgi:hypothetical protein
MPPHFGTHIIKRTFNNLKWSNAEEQDMLVIALATRSSVDNMLSTLEWKSLQDRRKDARPGMLYKIGG